MELRVNVGDVPRVVLLSTLNKLSALANVSGDVNWLHNRILQAVREQVPEYAQGGPVRTGKPVRVMPHGERGPEVTVYGEGTRVTPKGEPHAVRQNDLVAALKRVAESFPLHTETNRVLSLMARELLSPPDAPSTAFKAEPNPLGLGAVVRTDEGVFVRRIQNDNRDRVWWRVPDGEWYTDSEIGKPTEVLAPGVQL